MIALDFSFGQVNISSDTAHSAPANNQGAPANNQGVAVDENDAHAALYSLISFHTAFKRSRRVA